MSAIREKKLATTYSIEFNCAVETLSRWPGNVLVAGSSLPVEKFLQSFIHFSWRLILHPVAAVRNAKLAIIRVDVLIQVAHGRGDNSEVLLSENKQRGNSNPATATVRALALRRGKPVKNISAIIVDGSGKRAWLPRRFLVTLDVFPAKTILPDDLVRECLLNCPKILPADQPFGQTRNLKKEHVPTAQKLLERHIRAPRRSNGNLQHR